MAGDSITVSVRFSFPNNTNYPRQKLLFCINNFVLSYFRFQRVKCEILMA
jgi:hypothetical protein